VLVAKSRGDEMMANELIKSELGPGEEAEGEEVGKSRGARFFSASSIPR
jgi:hypothetical protein